MGNGESQQHLNEVMMKLHQL